MFYTHFQVCTTGFCNGKQLPIQHASLPTNYILSGVVPLVVIQNGSNNSCTLSPAISIAEEGSIHWTGNRVTGISQGHSTKKFQHFLMVLDQVYFGIKSR